MLTTALATSGCLEEGTRVSVSVTSMSAAVLLPTFASMPPRTISARSQARGEITSENVDDTVSGIGTPSMRNCMFAWSCRMWTCLSDP